MASHPRSELHRRALSISLAVTPFGVAFGVTCVQAGLTMGEALAFSSIVFTGSAQFAAVDILGAGGSVVSAVSAGLLLNLRSLAFGVLMAPALQGPWWWRALTAQLVIDESTAIGVSQSEPRWRRYGFLVAGVAVFVLWNVSTLLGAAFGSGMGDVVSRLGLDATIPAAFLALLWPRLAARPQRAVAVGGAVLSFLLVPVASPGLPVLAGVLGVAAAPLAGRRGS